MSVRQPRVCAAVCMAALTAGGCFIPGRVHAQAFEKVIPKPPPPQAEPTIVAPDQSLPVSRDRTVLLPQLKGVVFVGGMKRLQAKGVEPTGVAGGVAAPGLPLLSRADFIAQVKPYLGRPLTRAGLDAIANLVRETYRKAERPFIDVAVPPQNVQSGVVQIVLTEYRVGKINVHGNHYFSTRRVLAMSDLVSGQVLTLPTLREDLGQLNQNPFMTVNAVVKPGDATGLTDVDLAVDDHRPWRVYAGYDNQGTANLGRDEWDVGLNWGNVLGTGQLFSYQYTRSFSGRYTSHSFSDVVPLKGYQILLFGAYATQVPEIAPLFANEGHTAQMSGRFVADLPSTAALKENIELGFDYKRTDNNLEFSGFQIFKTNVEIDQFPLIYNLTVNDKHGQTVVENDLVYSPGGITKYNTTEALQQLIPGGSDHYVYDRLAVTRTTFLPWKVTWIARGLVQAASDDLPFSEQIGGGGVGVLRGYEPNVALGSEGGLFTQEFRGPAFSPLHLINRNLTGADQMQVGVFWDYADLTQPEALPDLPKKIILSSVGFNVNYNLKSNVHVQLDVGTQLRHAPLQTGHETIAALVTSISY